MTTSAKSQSPCIRQCSLNEQEVCIGCYRTLKEILDWTKYAESERLQVLKLCSERKIEKNLN